jgi:hypothetical protein
MRLLLRERQLAVGGAMSDAHNVSDAAPIPACARREE